MAPWAAESQYGGHRPGLPGVESFLDLPCLPLATRALLPLEERKLRWVHCVSGDSAGEETLGTLTPVSLPASVLSPTEEHPARGH